MAYGLFLYKEFKSVSNKTIRLEIFQKDYAGASMEIVAMGKAPVVLTIDNMNNEVQIPIIKSYLNINIKDTAQFDYSIFFTPDATKFKVVIKINSVDEWAGYLTPDSFIQNLEYRGEINLIARDNIGMLAEYDYDNTLTFTTIQNLITTAISKISFLSTLEFKAKKIDENSTNILSGLLRNDIFAGKSWLEALEITLKGIGCQMRFIGLNKYAIFDIGDINGYGDTATTQDFLFIEKSGVSEIVPAWKTIKVLQDYILTENFYDGYVEADEYSFLDNRGGDLENPYNFYVRPYYTIPISNDWVSTFAMLSPYDYPNLNPNDLFITGTESDSPLVLSSYLTYGKYITGLTDGTMIRISFKANNYPHFISQRRGGEYILNPMLRKHCTYIMKVRCNVFYQTATTKYVLQGQRWIEWTAGFSDSLEFNLPETQASYISGKQGGTMTSNMDNPIDQDIDISVYGLGEDGKIYIEFYPYTATYTIVDSDNDDYPPIVFSNHLMKLSEFSFSVVANLAASREAMAVINENHNINGEVELNVGEIPVGLGGYLNYNGGIYENVLNYYPPMTGFHRPSGVTYHLSELIGREVAHHYKTQRKKISGTIINSENRAAMPHFGKAFTDGILNYALNYGSLDLQNEVMQVELIEVEPYVTEDYTFIEAEVDTGGGQSLGSGTTEFIQWAAAGNAKRLYDLDTATEAEKEGAYVIVDANSFGEAKKYPLSSISDPFYSYGALQQTAITDNGNGSVTLGSGYYTLASNADGSGKIRRYQIAGDTFTLADMTQNYIVADFNSGNPILKVITNVTLINETTIVPVYSVFRRATSLHIQHWDNLGVSLVNKLHQSIVKTQRYRRESGLMISEYGTRNLQLTAGVVWTGAIPQSLGIVYSDLDDIYFYYHSGGVWQMDTIHSYNNFYYDDGSNLQELLVNRYAVNWVFRGIDANTHLYIVLGSGNYTLAQAQGASVPALPAEIQSHSMLVGKIIVQKNATTATSIQSAFDAQFSLSTPSSHPDLTNLAWSLSGHSGTATTLAGFNASGVASEYSISGSKGTSTTTFVTQKGLSDNYLAISDAYNKTELNNFFSGAVAITGYNKSNWDTAYGWGNHANYGYALAVNLSNHINDTSPHLSSEERTYFNKLKSYLKFAVDNTSMYSTINFYSESGVSAYGIGSGGGGGAGVDIIDNLLSVRADAALSANQGRILKGFVDLKQPQLNGTGFVKANGTSISYDNNSYALASHNHDTVYHPLMSTIFSLGGSYVAVRTANRTASQYYEFWDSGAGWAKIYSGGFVNANSSDSYILLGGGGTKAISDFATASHNHSGVYIPIGGLALLSDGLASLNSTVTSTNFRTSIFGASTSGWQIKAWRWDNVPPLLSGKIGNYGSAIVWAGSDTHGFLALDYHSSNGMNAVIGGGNGDLINWTANLLHAGNYSSYALPLAGGTLNGADAILNINSSTTQAWMYFKTSNINKASIGYFNGLAFIANDASTARIGVNDAGTPQYWTNSSSSTAYNLIHSGNIGSQSVNYATSAASAGNASLLASNVGSAASSLQYWQATSTPTLNPDSSWWYGLRMSHGDADTYYSATLAISFFADVIQFRRKDGGSDRPWQTLWHTGNDGSGSGLDADLLDGLQSENFVYGGNATKTIHSSYSLTSYFPSGFYYNNSQFVIHSSYIGVGNVAGLSIYANDATNGDLYFLVQAGYGGGVQRTIYHTGNLTSTLSNGYLPYWNVNTGRLEDSAIIQKTDGSSNVGVSNSNPQRRLHINSSSSPALRLESTGSNQGIEMLTHSSKYSWLLGAQYNIDGGFEITPSTEVGGSTFSTPVAVFKANGNVSIGYTDRSEKFAVAGSGYFNGLLVSATGLYTASGGKITPVSEDIGAAYIDYRPDLTDNQFHFKGYYGFRFSTRYGEAISINGANSIVTIHQDLRLNSLVDIASSVYLRSHINILNKAGSAWNTFATRNTSYADAFYDLSYIGTISANSYIQSASYLKGTSIKIGANWEAIPNGNDLELRYGGAMKAKLSSSGDILAVGGVTAFAV